MFDLQKEDQDKLVQDLDPQLSDPGKHKLGLNSIILVMKKKWKMMKSNLPSAALGKGLFKIRQSC